MGRRTPIEHNAALAGLLLELRQEAGLTQAELARKLDRAQSFVSKYEALQRRLDLLELREICEALGTTLDAFVARLETELKAIGPGTRPQRL